VSRRPVLPAGGGGADGAAAARAPRGHPGAGGRIRAPVCGAIRRRGRPAFPRAGRVAPQRRLAGQRAAAGEHDRADGGARDRRRDRRAIAPGGARAAGRDHALGTARRVRAEPDRARARGHFRESVGGGAAARRQPQRVRRSTEEVRDQFDQLRMPPLTTACGLAVSRATKSTEILLPAEGSETSNSLRSIWKDALAITRSSARATSTWTANGRVTPCSEIVPSNRSCRATPCTSTAGYRAESTATRSCESKSAWPESNESIGTRRRTCALCGVSAVALHSSECETP